MQSMCLNQPISTVWRRITRSELKLHRVLINSHKLIGQQSLLCLQNQWLKNKVSRTQRKTSTRLQQLLSWFLSRNVNQQATEILLTQAILEVEHLLPELLRKKKIRSCLLMYSPYHQANLGRNRTYHRRLILATKATILRADISSKWIDLCPARPRSQRSLSFSQTAIKSSLRSRRIRRSLKYTIALAEPIDASRQSMQGQATRLNITSQLNGSQSLAPKGWHKKLYPTTSNRGKLRQQLLIEF